MPIISQFYGIVITMYANEQDRRHHKPHIHIRYNNLKAVYDLECDILAGSIPYKQRKLVEAWIIIHKQELNNLWNLLQEGKEYFKISPLK